MAQRVNVKKTVKTRVRKSSPSAQYKNVHDATDWEKSKRGSR